MVLVRRQVGKPFINTWGSSGLKEIQSLWSPNHNSQLAAEKVSLSRVRYSLQGLQMQEVPVKQYLRIHHPLRTMN